MQTPALTTINKMLESLPESIQEQVANHLRRGGTVEDALALCF